MDKLSAIKAFVRVVEAGTFTKAADSIGVPKTQVSRLVQFLEHSLKTKLLTRSTRRVLITQEGASYYEWVVRVLAEMEEVESRMTDADRHPRGNLRIQAPSCIANMILLPAMGDFNSRYPDIEIEMGVCDGPVDLVGENIDCGFWTGHVTNLGVIARRVGDIRFILCAASSYLGELGVPESPPDLEDGRHRVVSIVHRGRSRFEYVLNRGDEKYQLAANSKFCVDHGAAVLSAALAGLGVTASSTFTAAPHLASGALSRVLPEWHAGSMPLHVVYAPTRRACAKVRVFVDWATELISNALEGATAQDPRGCRPAIAGRTKSISGQ